MANLPPIRDVNVQEFSNGFFFTVNYNLTDPFKQEQIPFTMKLLDQVGQEPIVFDYEFDGESAKPTFETKDEEFSQPDPPPE